MPKDQALDVDKTRRQLIESTFEAFNTAKKLADRASDKPGKQGGTSPKAKWFQVMGYLSQTLNGLLQNADDNETKHQLAEVQRVIAELQEGSSKGNARSGQDSSDKETV